MTTSPTVTSPTVTSPSVTSPNDSSPTLSSPTDASPTDASPTLRSTWQRARFPLALAGLVLLAALLVLATVGRGGQGALDPDTFAPQGSRGLAQLLRDNGTRVTRVTDVPAAVRDLGPGMVVFAPLLYDLSADELALLARLPVELVLVAPTSEELQSLGVPARTVGTVGREPRRPACDLPAATRAGTAELGGVTYEATGPGPSIDCYATEGHASLLRLPAERVTVLGSGGLFTNDKLANAGNASLTLGLLGGQTEVRWLVPAPERQRIGAQRTRSLNSFVPASLGFSLLQLAVVLAVLALWRARRLGRVVAEPLPVVVRAAEAVEGRSRLYRAARATGAAAEQLRAGARQEVDRRLGGSGPVERAVLVTRAAARTGRDPLALDALLYGAAPADDAALVRLAHDLDDLTREVADS